jgi:large subunit ribosomal protein L35
LSASAIRVGAPMSFRPLAPGFRRGCRPALPVRDHPAGLPFGGLSAITPPPRCPAEKGCRGGGQVLNQHARIEHHRDSRSRRIVPPKESQMPKLKTKSGAKKRFKVTGTGKVLFAQSGKRHGMIKRSTKQIRDHRGTKVMFKTDGDRIKKYWLIEG